MKPLIILLLISSNAISQKWYKISKNDIAIMGLEVVSGYAKGWGDEIEYHHYELSQRFPGLFKNNNHFWDGRYDDDGIWDAKHLASAITIHTQIAAVCIKIGDIKAYPKKDRWKKIIFDALKYTASYHLGFFLSYNLTHGNKIF